MNGLDWTTVYWLYLLVAGGICVFLIIYLIPHRAVLSARYLLLLMIAVAESCITSAMELKVTGLADKLFWVKLEYFGVSWTGVLFLFFILIITGRETWLTSKRQLLLSLIPAVTIILAVTNDIHHLIWADAWLNTDGPVPLVAYHRSIGLWIIVAYSYVLLVMGTFILIKELFIARPLYRKKLLVVLLGVLIPWVANGIYLFNLSPFRHLDITPFAFTISGLAFTWGVFRYQLMTIISLARKTIIVEQSSRQHFTRGSECYSSLFS